MKITSASETIRKPPLVKAQIALGKQKARSVERGYLSVLKFCEKLLPRAKFYRNQTIGC